MLYVRQENDAMMFSQARSLLGRTPTWAIFLVGAMCGVWASHSTNVIVAS
jgi:hypothetical protein